MQKLQCQGVGMVVMCWKVTCMFCNLVALGILVADWNPILYCGQAPSST
jgi:hypothetical protein